MKDAARTEAIRRRYDRWARWYDLWEAPMEYGAVRRWRRCLWDQARGDILEIGVGTGKNARFYPDGGQVTAVDFSPRMLERAAARLAREGKSACLLLADVQDLPFADASFDTVVGTFVFCSVPDPVLGLREVRRVLRPGGRLLLLEHVRSRKRFLGALMDLFNPVTVRLVGVNINRDTLANVRAAGFAAVAVTPLAGDIVLQIAAEA